MNRLTRRHRSWRRGGALVEFAIVMPVLFMIIYGAIEASNLLHLQQAITETAYDGALRASRNGATDADVTADLNALLQARGIQAQSIVIGDGVTLVEDLPHGQLFSVKISADTEGHLISPKIFAQFSTVDVRVVARKQ